MTAERSSDTDGSTEPTDATGSPAGGQEGISGDGNESRVALSQLSVQRIKPSYSQVSEQIRELILRGDVLPGQRLPVEPELAELFGVGRSTVREAIRQLASEGLVTTRRGTNGGTFVCLPESEEVEGLISTNINMLISTGSLSIDEIREARAGLEGPAAALAARRRTPEQLEAIESTLVVSSDEDVLLNRRTEFHTLVIEASGNRLLRTLIRPVFAVAAARYHEDERLDDDFWHQIDGDHRSIAQAIADQDVASARTLMEQHMGHLDPLY